MSADWFVTQIPRPRAPIQLFCLPHAGAGAAAYALWPQAVGPDVEVQAFIPPGRERRHAEKPTVDPVAMAAAISARADRPFALFGHSLGGRLAFEVARDLRRTGRPLPLRLLISGCTPPDEGRTGDIYEGLSELDDDRMLERLVRTGNIPDEILAEPDLVAMLLPVFRSDFGWIDTYVYAHEPALPVPISVFAGTADDSAPPERMRGWQAHTASGFVLHTFGGGHFFLAEHLAEVVARVHADLATPVATGESQG
jgi:surfactin synthase thioesterase subunit